MYQFPFFPDTIPDELKPGSRWLVCDQEKVPMVALVKGWRHASSTNPKTWRSYTTAIKAFETERYAGVGRVIQQCGPYVGVDLDNCHDPQTGRIDERGSRILGLLDSYSEVSPSGKGVKVWMKASLERSYAKPGFEVYTRGRYFTTTGQILPRYSTTIEERSAELADLLREEFPRPKRRRTFSAPYDGPPIDLYAFLEEIEIFGEVPDGGGTKLTIRCPWISEHSEEDASGTYVGQFVNGALWFRCHHSHCWRRDWHDFRRGVSPKLTISMSRAERASGAALEVTINRD